MDLSNDEVFVLLKKIGEGSESAMRELYRAYSRTIYAYVLNQLQDPDETEEIVNDTMHEVWKHPDRFRGESRFKTWLIGIARHKMLSVLRTWRRHKMLRVLSERDEDEDEIDKIPSGAPGPDESAEIEERRKAVRRCMEKLSDVHRECLHLTFYEGLSVGEIALIQGCPENTVKTRLFHARTRIEPCLRLLLKSEQGK